ncbi:plexin domain-containing protein 2-like isoform X1 [Branchiostoma lanceolatum]|uniref:plexin domain-containing protein 2-like isoform X1 n=1 Tax=Branchiostoma lanceolatum TaxID=7740 RepID=UPI00345276AB
MATFLTYSFLLTTMGILTVGFQIDKETADRFRRNAQTQPPTPTSNVPQTVGPTVEETRHQYYISQYYPSFPPGGTFREDLTRGDVRTVVRHGSPSVHHRQDKPVGLSFDFKFYGHYVRNISISTSGYLNTGAYPSFVTDTQYVAPLFDSQLDSSLDTEASVRYRDNGTAFTVEWRRLRLGRPPGVCCFTFQATLLQGGRIVFTYLQVPQEGWADARSDVKVGVSDAFKVKKRPAHDPKRERLPVKEYHRVKLDLEKVRSDTIFVLIPQPTCGDMTDCSRCLNSSIEFDCGWCSTLDRCSDGNDWLTTTWNDADCPMQVKNPPCKGLETTSRPSTSPSIYSSTVTSSVHPSLSQEKTNTPHDPIKANPGQRLTPGPKPPNYEVPRKGRSMETDAIVGILVGMFIMIAIIAWTVHICSKKKSEPKVVVVQVG